MNTDLETLYTEAQSALKAKDYDRASDLLRQILKADVDYKDAALLLARTIRLSRRRGYNDPRLWGALGLVVVVALGFFIAPRVRSFYAVQPTAPLILDSPTATLPPTAIATATETPLPTPTSIPLTWKRVSLGQEFDRDAVTDLVIDPKDPEVLYAGMENAGIFKSIDGGLSWRPAHQGLASAQVTSLLIDIRNSQILYAGTPGGIFKTEDGGENWYKFAEEIYLLMDPQDSTHLYKRDSDTIYESIDQGKSWETVYTSKDGCPGEILGWTIHPSDGDTLFVGGGEFCEPGVYISNDRGQTWTLLTKIAIRDGGYTIHDMGLDNLTIDLDKQGNFYVRIGSTHSEYERGVKHHEQGIWRTILELDDKPATFDSTGSVYFHCDTRLCKFNLEKRQRETLGKPNVGDFTLIAPSPFDPNIIYVAGNGLAVSKDGGMTWANLNNGLGSTLLSLEAGLGDAEMFFLFSGNCVRSNLGWTKDAQLLYISTNGGSTWDLSVEAGCYLIQDADGITLYRISYSHGGERLWRSQDEGKSWRMVSVPPGIAVAFTADPIQSGTLYLNGWGDYHDQYVSEDYGNNWIAIGPPPDIKLCYGATPRFIDAYRPMAIDPSDGNHVFVIDNGALLESHDSCETTSAFGATPNTNMNSIAFDRNTPGTLYAGSDQGAYISFDSGTTWHQINDGLLGATVVYSIAVDSESNVYAATPYGIFKLESK